MELDKIYLGDCRELGEQIEDNSVDMVFTDPPYPRKYLYLYEWLGKFAQRVLKPGAYLFAYGAGETQIECLNYLAQAGLNYFWSMALMHHGGTPRMWHKKLMSTFKPVYVFTKGKPEIVKWQATSDSDTKDKRYHKWGQGIEYPTKKIEMFTNPGALIVDPFCGGGQVPAACISTDRRFIAFENSPETIEIAQERIEELRRQSHQLVLE